MAVFKYLNPNYVEGGSEPKWIKIPLTGSAVITPVQSTGQSEVDVMSQKAVTDALNTKQNTLVSGTNIKTINDETILGNGNISIEVPDVSNFVTEVEVDQKISSLVASAPETLDTLNELAAALGDDPNFATTVTNKIAAKQDKLVSGTNIKTINGQSLLGNGDVDMSEFATQEDVADINQTIDSLGDTYATKDNLSGYLPLNGGGSGGATIYGYNGISINGYISGHPSEPYIAIMNANYSLRGDNIAAVSSGYGIGFRPAGYPQLYIGEFGVRYITYNGTTNIVDKTWDEILDSDATFNNGHNAVSSVAGIPVSKRLVIATISNNGSFTLASTPADGREIHVIVHNTSSSDIEITMPSGSNYVKMSGDTLTVAGNSYADINVISDGTNMYIRAL